MLKAALVGAGGWGKTHVANWSRLDTDGLVEFACAADVNPDNLSEVRSADISCFSSDVEMYESVHPDVVSIAAGIPLHLELVKRALEHGVNVLLEKPAAATVDEVRQMIDLQRRYAGLFVLVAFQFIYTPETRILKELLVSGKYGKIRSAAVRGFVKRNDAYYARNDWAGRIYNRQGYPVFDSPLSNAFAHYLNLALFLTADSKFESAGLERVENVRLLKARPEIENYDVCSFRAVTCGNIPIDVQFSHASAANEWPNLSLILDDGIVRWYPNEWFLFAPDGKTVREHVVFKEDPQYEMFRTVASLTSGQEVTNCICTLEVALEHTRCVEMVQKYPITALTGSQVVRHTEEGGYYDVPFPDELLK